MLSPRDLREDVVAGLTVACVAIPLSLAIALASGVAPAVGLVTAIVSGVVCALFGGTRLAVSGPAAAMAVLIGTLVAEHGLAALLIVGLGCGLLQILTGVLGLGRFVRLVPRPVIEGFTAGIGAIILVGQLPRALGLPPPDQSHVVDVITHIGELLHRTNVAAVLVTLATLAVIYGLPKLMKRAPAHLVAVVLTSLAVFAFGLDVATLGDIPRSLPAPRLPEVPKDVPVLSLVGASFVVYALASLETLLSTTAVDKLSPGSRSDPDQELIGQGIGNGVVALFGGIPVTSVIARSAMNVTAGAKTRRAAILHAAAIFLAVLVFAPVIGRIPIPALAGVLFAVALRMLDPRGLMKLFRHSTSDGIVSMVTFAVIVSVGLLEGVQWGVVAALVIAAVRLGRTRLSVRGARVAEHHSFVIRGPLTFLSSLALERLRSELEDIAPGRGVLIDVSDVSVMDASGAEMLAALVEQSRSHGQRPVVLGLTDEQRAHFVSAGKDLGGTVVTSEREAMATLGSEASADRRLRAGVERYRDTLRPRYSSLFEQLAGGQSPHTLFITCSDSRIQPNLITATEPGELFIVRDIGAIVPPEGAVRGSSVAAAIDYAVGVLHVRKIVVCGHSGCGAVSALTASAGVPRSLPNLEAWLAATRVRETLATLPGPADIDALARLVTLAQLDNIRSYEVVRAAEGRGELDIDSWFFDVGGGELEEWSKARGLWVPVAATREEPRAA